MQNQIDYRARACIAISSLSSSFNGKSFCRCSQRGRLCKEPDFCPRCNLDIRVDKALTEYGQVFGRAPYWMALVPSSTANPRTAGLHWCVQKNEVGIPTGYKDWIPLPSRDSLPRYGSGPEMVPLLEKIAKVPFDFANRLKTSGLIDGAYVAREIDLDFRPCKRGENELSVDHTALVHGNMLVNTRRPPCWDLMLEMFDHYIDACYEHDIPSYADLMGSKLDSQKEINGWISYELKPMPIPRWYNEGLARGCNIPDLNMAFDLTVFGGVKFAMGRVKSPRKIGNLYCQTSNYIGQKPPLRLSNKDLNRWLDDPVFAAHHPDWEASVLARTEKWTKRKGRSYQDKMTLPVAD